LLALAALPLAAQTFAPGPTAMRWRLVGPFRGGRSLSAVGVPGQPSVFYFGAVGGGVWKTTDAGNTWKPIFDGEPIASIGAVAVAPSDPKVIYAGSGEADMRSDISYGDGMYKSTDGGKTWTHIGLDDTRHIGAILIDPANPDVVYVAALGHAYGPNQERGVFKSTNGGQTWQKVLYKDENTGAIALAFEPGNANVIYAALWQTRRPPWNIYPPANGPGSGLYKSTDGGATWTQLTQGLPRQVGRIGIAVAPSAPQRVYLIVDAEHGGVYRSDDGGQSFSLVDGERRIWGRGWYFGGITVDPKNADVVYVANTSTYRSTDGGHSFDALKGAPGGDDYHSIWVSPDDSNHIILASDQGVIVSLNDGRTWSSWYNQPTAQFYHVSADNRFPFWLYGAQQDSGAMAVPSASHYGTISFRDWHPIGAGGESGTVVPDPLDGNILYGGTVTRYDQATGATRNISPMLGRTQVFRHTWTLPLIFSPADPHALYFSNQYLFVTRDGGQSWRRISPDLTRPDPGVPSNLDPVTAKDAFGGPRRGVIYTIAPSPLDAHTIWIGTDDGLIQLSRDDGRSWRNVTPAALTPWSKVGMIEASHFHVDTAYAAVDRHRLDDLAPYIYRTRDGGRTWQKIVAGIPEGAFVNAIREDPKRAGLLYAGTELGIYVSFDDGGAWQPLQMNLPVTSIRDIVVHDNDLAVATHGRAFWILDDITLLRQWSALKQSVGGGAKAFLFAPETAYRVRPGSNDGTPLPPETPTGEEPPSGAILDYYLAAPAQGAVTLEILDGAGRLVRRYSSADHPPAVNPKSLDIPMYWIHPAPVLAAGAGLHRWVWDLHYATPAGAGGVGRGFGFFRGGGGLWAVPGQYQVRLTVDGRAYTRPLTLVMDPRVHVPLAVLRRQFELGQQVQAASVEAARLLRLARARHLAALLGEQPALGADFSGEGGPETDHTSLRYLSGLLRQIEFSIEGADAPPTAEALRAWREAQALLASARAQVRAGEASAGRR